MGVATMRPQVADTAEAVADTAATEPFAQTRQASPRQPSNLPRQQLKLLPSRRALAPDQRDVALRPVDLDRPGHHLRALEDAGIECQLREQGDAEAVVDHLHQGGEARCLERVGVGLVADATGGESMAAQAVAFL